MDYLTSAGVLFLAATGLSFYVQQTPEVSWSSLNRRLGHIFIFSTQISAIAGIVCLAFGAGWWGIAYAAGTIVAVPHIVVRSGLFASGLDGIVTLIGFALIVAACVLVYLR